MKLARRYLEWAEADFQSGDWSRCVASAQLAVENAGKSIVACYGPVPRTHDPAEAIAELVMPALPEDLAVELKEVLPLFREYGGRVHVAATYGDERHLVAPWEIFREEDARRAVEAARQCVHLAEKVLERSS